MQNILVMCTVIYKQKNSFHSVNKWHGYHTAMLLTKKMIIETVKNFCYLKIYFLDNMKGKKLIFCIHITLIIIFQTNLRW